jgi:hypothetical protein
MAIEHFLLALALVPLAWSAEPRSSCQPSPELETEFRTAAAAASAVTDPFAALDKAAPFLAMRDRHPDNIFAHERYQDAVHEYGIEGHLQLLTRKYAELASKHPGDAMYRYLLIRATVGRSTPAAIRDLKQMLTENPDFAPAHRTLAEIYRTQAFHHPDEEKLEKEKFLAACPGAAFTTRPPSIPAPSPLLNEAARLWEKSSDTSRVVALIIQGLKEFEWRSQRIRAFDWYTRDYKIQDARELRAKYWQAWPLMVRAYRKAGRSEDAQVILASMEQGARQLRYLPGSGYWDATEVLARLYAEDRQTARASEKIQELERLLAEAQDPDQRAVRGAQLASLRKAASL